ncbi:unnamed protein product [Paramecium pentaurelia]|uniref:Tetratricopeptide repeat protein n=1 Tax=Paramecium pentaurelia TaxID=43138 RepID=A0A8S1Y293_9CILI|nr:unnamed protein product [Paramecium pentaurelia]
MNQISYSQQSQEIKCNDHPDKPALFWCKSIDCKENRIFCLNCQKQKKHGQHYDQDIQSIQELQQFLIDQSKYSKVLVSECQLQFQLTLNAYDKLISGLSYKFCGIEEKTNQFETYQIYQALDSMVQLDEFKNHLKNNILGFLQKFQKILDDLFVQLELHLIKYQITDQQIKLNKEEYQRGISLNAKNKKNEAIQIFDRLLLTEPYNIEIMYQKGQQYQQFQANSLNELKNVRDALQIHNNILTINPKYEISFLTMGKILRNQKSYQQAQQQYEKCVQLNINNQEAQFGIERLINLIRLYNTIKKLLKQIHPIKTISIIKEIAQGPQKDFKKLLILMIKFQLKTLIMQNLWQEKEYVQSFQKGLMKQTQQQQNHQIQKIIVFQGYVDMVQYQMKMLGIYLFSINQKKEAIYYFDKALAIDPFHVNSLYGKSGCLRIMNQYQQALLQYDQVLDIDSQHVNSLYGKSECLKMMKKYEDALKWIEKALAVDSQHVNSLQGKGGCLKKMNKFQEALEFYDQALLLDPQHFYSLYGKSECLLMMKQFEQSIEQIEKALAMHPQHVNSLLLKGQCLRMMNKSEEALKWYEKALALHPNDVSSLNGKGECLRMMNQYQQSFEYFQKALTIDPWHVNSLYGKGECLRMMNQYQQSLECFQKALVTHPQHINSLYGKGECLRMMNLFDQALQYFEKALAIDPQHVNSLFGKAFILLEYNQYDNAYSLQNQANQIMENKQLSDVFLTIYTEKLQKK